MVFLPRQFTAGLPSAVPMHWAARVSVVGSASSTGWIWPATVSHQPSTDSSPSRCSSSRSSALLSIAVTFLTAWLPLMLLTADRAGDDHRR